MIMSWWMLKHTPPTHATRHMLHFSASGRPLDWRKASVADENFSRVIKLAVYVLIR